jgi:hypothetical protein
MNSTHPTDEKKQSLWLLTVSPAIWAAHFMLCYLTAALWCAKIAEQDGSIMPVRTSIVIYTLLALIGIGIAGRVGYRKHSFGNASQPHDDDSPEDRHRFLGFAMLLLSALSAVAVLYASLAALFIWSCH